MRFAAPELTQLAQAQPASTPRSRHAARRRAPRADAQAPVEEPIGNVATVTGSASVVRNDETTPLKVKDDIYLNDVVQTGANSALGITFNDATTFNLKANAQITIDTYVYEDGGKSNAGVFDVAKGTVAFVAAAVAKTGDMKITTPTATLGIRGTTGLVEVPEGAAANNPNNVAIKLYPDADGRVGRIEVNDRAGARLGFLTQGASGFTIRPGAGGARFAAVPLAISPQMMLARPGFCAPGSLDAKSRPPGRAAAARIPPRQPRLQPQQRAAPLAAAKRIAGTEPHRPAAGLAESSRSAAARSAKPSRTTTIAEPAGSTAKPQQPGSPNRQGQQQLQRPGSTPPSRRAFGLTQQTGVPPRPGQPQQPAAAGRPGAPAPTGAPVQQGVPAQPSGPQRLQQPGSPPPGAPQPGSGKACGPAVCPACCDRACRRGRPARAAKGQQAAAEGRAVGNATRYDPAEYANESRRAAKPVAHLLHEAAPVADFAHRRDMRGLRRADNGRTALETRCRQRDRSDLFEKRALVAAREPIDRVRERQPLHRLDVAHQFAHRLAAGFHAPEVHDLGAAAGIIDQRAQEFVHGQRRARSLH